MNSPPPPHDMNKNKIYLFKRYTSVKYDKEINTNGEQKFCFSFK